MKSNATHRFSILLDCTIMIVICIVFDVLRGNTSACKAICAVPLGICGAYIIMLTVDTLVNYIKRNK